MARGRKATTTFPDCELPMYHLFNKRLYRLSSVVELSEDGKKVRCNLCATLRIQTSHWIQKESLVYYLKSDVHACSISAQQNRETIWATGEWSMQEEAAIKERMDFIMLSTTKPVLVTATASVPGPSVEEKEMWDNYSLSNEIFNARNRSYSCSSWGEGTFGVRGHQFWYLAWCRFPPWRRSKWWWTAAGWIGAGWYTDWVATECVYVTIQLWLISMFIVSSDRFECTQCSRLTWRRGSGSRKSA